MIDPLPFKVISTKDQTFDCQLFKTHAPVASFKDQQYSMRRYMILPNWV